MSFWDHVKPAVVEPAVIDSALALQGRALQLRWDDGRSTEISSRLLRQQCPCATCVDEWTQKRTFDPARIKPDMTVVEAAPVGNYGLRLAFADGHRTGIFPWKLLHELSGANSANGR
jgi:DUF971 family protein